MSTDLESSGFKSVLFIGQKVELSHQCKGCDAIIFHDDGVYTLLKKPPQTLDDATAVLVLESHAMNRNIKEHSAWRNRVQLISNSDWVKVVKYAEAKRFI